MLGKSVSLVGGLFLLLFGAYISLQSLNTWKPFWRQQEKAAAQPAQTHSPNADAIGPELKDAASIKAIGPLASAAAQHANDAALAMPDTAVPTDDANDAKPAPTPAANGTLSALDRAAGVAGTPAESLVHQSFVVTTYEKFPFVVPPHSLHPHIHGQFHTQDAGKNVDVLLMDAREYEEFSHNHPTDATFSNEDSSGGAIDWTLHPTLLEAQKYYLVFASSHESGGQTPVNADFTVSFE
jgi:hypothetical protein